MRWCGYRGGRVEYIFDNEKCDRLNVVTSIDACLVQIDIGECVFNRNTCNEEVKPTILGSVNENAKMSIQTIFLKDIIAPINIPVFEIEDTKTQCVEFQTSYSQNTVMHTQGCKKTKMLKRLRKQSTGAQSTDVEIYQFVKWCSIIEMRMVHHFNYEIMMQALCLVSNKEKIVLKASSDMKSREMTRTLNIYISMLLNQKYIKV